MDMMSLVNDAITSIDQFYKISLGENLFKNTGSLISKIAPVFGLGLSVYMCLVIWQYYRNGLDEFVVSLSKQVFGLLIVVALAFNAANYTEIAKAIYDLPDFLAALVTGSSENSSAIKNGIVASFQIATKMVDPALKQAGVTNFVAPLVTILAGVWSLTVSLVTFLILWAFYLLAKVSLALVLLVGPLFVGAMLFPSTRQYGMNWIGQCLNFSVTAALLAGISTLQIAWVEEKVLYVTNQLPEKLAIMGVIGVAMYFTIFAIICIIVALNVPSITSALTGGATATFNARTLAAAVNPAKAAITQLGRAVGIKK